jgi:hypothetical protein
MYEFGDRKSGNADKGGHCDPEKTKKNYAVGH